MPKLVCAVDHLPYAGVVYRQGDKFFASDADARMLKGFGKARDAVPQADQSRQADAFASEGEEPKPRRGRYRRADMRAED